MSPRRIPIVLALVASSVFATSGAPAASEGRERAEDARQEGTRCPVALTVNPLGFLIQRYGGNVEWSFAPHHAITTSAYVQSVPVEMVRPFAGEIEIRD